MSDTSTPPPFPGSSPTTVKGHATNMVRNVTVSVLSTVLGATMIWLLGFNHNSSSSGGFLEIKDATMSAWKSYETYENTYTKNSQSLLQDLKNIGPSNLDDFLTQTHTESDKFLKSVGELAKGNNLDKDLVTALNRRIDNEKLSMPKLDDYIKQIKDIVNGNLGDNEKQTALHNADLKWVSVSDGMFHRAINDIEEIAKTLSERYAQPFSMDDFLVIKLYNENKKTADSLANLNQNKNNPVNNPTNNNAGTNITPSDNNNNTNKDAANTGNNNTGNNNGITIDGKFLAGQWTTSGAHIEFSADGKFYWEVLANNQETQGNWQFNNNQLYMYPSGQNGANGGAWIFNLMNVVNNSFTMKLTVSPYNTYSLVRATNGN